MERRWALDGNIIAKMLRLSRISVVRCSESDWPLALFRCRLSGSGTQSCGSSVRSLLPPAPRGELTSPPPLPSPAISVGVAGNEKCCCLEEVVEGKEERRDGGRKSTLTLRRIAKAGFPSVNRDTHQTVNIQTMSQSNNDNLHL